MTEPVIDNRFEDFTDEEREAYHQYLSDGYADTDGYWGPLHPQHWLANHRRSQREE